MSNPREFYEVRWWTEDMENGDSSGFFPNLDEAEAAAKKEVRECRTIIPATSLGESFTVQVLRRFYGLKMKAASETCSLTTWESGKNKNGGFRWRFRKREVIK